MLGPQHIGPIIRFFDSVDIALTSRLLRPVAPDEPALTNEFCALMDADTQRREHRPEFTIDHLNSELAECGDNLNFKLQIDTHSHNAALEHLVSQSDFALILKYTNHVLPEESWKRCYLFQAKRLFRSAGPNAYNQGARFRSIDANQHKTLNHLTETFGEDLFYYFLYTPR